MSEAKLIQQLSDARSRLERAIQALAPKHKGGEWEEYKAAQSALLAAERALASARGESFAEPLAFPVQWDIGAPMPHMVQSDHGVLLAFLLGPASLAGDEQAAGFTEVQIADVHEPEPLAIVRFHGCIASRMGAPNDEVFEGHPLYGRGLQAYRPMIVRNSAWISELQTINSVHMLYDANRWTSYIHYFFGFHDSVFECVARSCDAEVHSISMADALELMTRRILD